MTIILNARIVPGSFDRMLFSFLMTSVAFSSGIQSSLAQDSRSQNQPDNSASSGKDNIVTDDIIVTATRQARSLSKVPASIVATTQETLDRQGIRDIGDLSRITPSVTFVPASDLPGVSNIYIRGVQSTSGIPTTGIYIDDTPVQTRTGGSPDLSNPYPKIFDLDRTEVLRGPQGTLFGSGSVGGAVRFITPEPSLSKSSLYSRAEIATTEGGAPSGEFGVAGGAPVITDTLGFRASAWYRRDGGYIDKLDRVTKERIRKNANSGDSYVARLAFKWQPVEQFTLTPSIFFQNIENDDTPAYERTVSQPSRQKFADSVANLKQFNKDRFYLPALKSELDLGGANLITNTSYLHRKIRTLNDTTALDLSVFADHVGTPPPELASYYAAADITSKQKVFTQEVRLQNSKPDARLNWVAGLFYSRQTTDDSFYNVEPFLLNAFNYQRAQQGQGPIASVADLFGVDLYQGQYSAYWSTRQKDIQKAAFAQVDFKITSKLTATAGIRYTDAKYDYNNFILGPLFRSTGTSTALNAENKNWTPKFGISYQANPENLFYANAAKGVRGSGAAGPVGPSCTDDAQAIGIDPNTNRTITPDSIWSYEVGSKNKLLGGRLLVDASAYRIDWKNVQTTLNLPLCRLNTTLNVGDARSQGFDLALSGTPMRGLQLGVSVSYDDAHYTSNVPGPGAIIIRRKGEPLDVPPWSLYLNGEYEFAIADAKNIYVRGDYSYTSRVTKPLDLESPLTNPYIPRRAASNNLNLRVGFRSDAIDVSLFAANALNNHPILSQYADRSSSGPGNFRAVTTRPRTIGLTATFRR